MMEILEQQQRLLVEGTLDLLGCLGVVPFEVGSAESFITPSVWFSCDSTSWLPCGVKR